MELDGIGQSQRWSVLVILGISCHRPLGPTTTVTISKLKQRHRLSLSHQLLVRWIQFYWSINFQLQIESYISWHHLLSGKSCQMSHCESAFSHLRWDRSVSGNHLQTISWNVCKSLKSRRWVGGLVGVRTDCRHIYWLKMWKISHNIHLFKSKFYSLGLINK